LNQLERWLALLSQRAIRRGSFRSVKDLVDKIDSFVQHYNRSRHAASLPVITERSSSVRPYWLCCKNNSIGETEPTANLVG
jgi:hypothetical protein